MKAADDGQAGLGAFDGVDHGNGDHVAGVFLAVFAGNFKQADMVGVAGLDPGRAAAYGAYGLVVFQDAHGFDHRCVGRAFSPALADHAERFSPDGGRDLAGVFGVNAVLFKAVDDEGFDLFVADFEDFRRRKACELLAQDKGAFGFGPVFGMATVAGLAFFGLVGWAVDGLFMQSPGDAAAWFVGDDDLIDQGLNIVAEAAGGRGQLRAALLVAGEFRAGLPVA